MVFNSKQLEELENIHDSTGAFEEEGDDEGGFDEVGEAAMDWRRGLIEEAVENVKRAKSRALEPHLQYPIGSLMFDRDVRRFARVQRSVPGYLKIVYLAGEDREMGTLDVVGYLRDYGAGKRVSELAEQLALSDVDVSHELDRLGITPLPEPEEPVPAEGEAAPADAAAAAAAPTKGAARPSRAEGEQGTGAAAVKGSKPAAAGPKAVNVQAAPSGKAQGKAPAKAAAPAKGGPPVAAKGGKPGAGAPAPTGKGVNPIDDPNGYIKAHYTELSNRELARLTGLSEHTIRRKLGEWGLKRKKD
jgi:hypothetical protein